MRNRTPLYCLVGLLVAVVLVCAATNLAAGNKHTSQAWMRAQERSQLLWMMDGCAVIIFLGSWVLGAAISGLQNESASRSNETTRHIAVLTETVQDLFRQNNDYVSRLEALEESGDAWHDGFEEEARRLTEQAFLALSDNIETNALQLEAVNLALRYQRVEMQAFRSAFKSGVIAPEAGTPPPLDAFDRAIKPILPEWRNTQVEIAAKDSEMELDDDVTYVEDPDSDTVETAETNAELDLSIAPDIEETNDPDLELKIEDTLDDEGSSGSETEEADEPDLELNIEDTRSVESYDLRHTTYDLTDEPTPPDLAEDQTVNAGSTVVETLEFDAATGSAVVNDRDDVQSAKDTSAKSTLAADEYRRSREEPRSIFRRNRQ